VSVVLSASSIAKRYGELEALTDISFEVRAGEIVAVLGPNGAGKTTLLSILARVQPPSSGALGGDARGVGWAPQQPALYSKLSVAENLELFARLERLPDPAAAVARMLEQTGLADSADVPVGRLSGGNRQRVNVALGLIGDPPVLALDEPSAALDPGQRERLWRFIAGLAQAGRTVVFSTHNVVEAQRYAGRVIVLAEGRMLFDDTPAALLSEAGEFRGGEAGGGGSVDLERALLTFLQQRSESADGERR
jgi:ABC-2 type transport system ATP-binding protein